MKAIELLSPAGAYPILKAVIGAGADAVYVGGPAFGARAYADNFSKEELLESIDYAHIHNRKVYLTVNTLLKEREMEEQLFDYLLPYYEQGLDAVIVQDFGVLTFIREAFPQLSIHASTQMTVTGTDGAAFLQKQGASRIVTARELSFEEIQKIKSDTGVEIESFVHGALCYCYSGECLLSSMLGGRSGNRGRCAQPCRLPYEINGGKECFPLSMRDMCTIDLLPELIESGVDSFKIEGRMKSPSYVGYITRIYRKLIDNYQKNNKEVITKEEENNLKILFNRSFTNGYLFKDKVMNISSSNHQGLEIGKVIDITPKKIKIKLSDNLYQEDGIRFKNSNKGMIANYIYNENNLLINKASKGDIIYLDNKINLKDKDILVKTSSPYLDKEILSISEKKIKIDVNIEEKDNNLYITFQDKDNNKVSSVLKVEVPLTRNTTKEEIKMKISKLGNTPFISLVWNIKLSYLNRTFVEEQCISILPSDSSSILFSSSNAFPGITILISGNSLSKIILFLDNLKLSVATNSKVLLNVARDTPVSTTLDSLGEIANDVFLIICFKFITSISKCKFDSSKLIFGKLSNDSSFKVNTLFPANNLIEFPSYDLNSISSTVIFFTISINFSSISNPVTA